MNPNQMRFSLPILVEVPHIASVKGREREIIIVRSETGNSWKEHTLEANEQAINDSLGDAFGKLFVFLCLVGLIYVFLSY